MICIAGKACMLCILNTYNCVFKTLILKKSTYKLTFFIQQTMEDLLTNLSNITTYINTHNYQLPKKMSTATRISNWICCPLACSPCFIWSATWRLIACPFQCIFRVLVVIVLGHLIYIPLKV